MRIEDLSVGDWTATELAQLAIEGNDIATAFVDKVKKPIQIISVLGDEQIVFGRIEELDGFTTIYLKAEHIEPIPLTPEILEKNGFVKKNYDNGKMWDWWCDNVLVRKFADEDIYRFIVAFNSKHYTTMMVVGKHTHQLQHALRLAGVGKEIEL